MRGVLGMSNEVKDLRQDARMERRIVSGCLAAPKRFRHLRDAARRTVLDQYDFRNCLPRLLDYVRS
jgi:hypothetical protein